MEVKTEIDSEKLENEQKMEKVAELISKLEENIQKKNDLLKKSERIKPKEGIWKNWTSMALENREPTMRMENLDLKAQENIVSQLDTDRSLIILEICTKFNLEDGDKIDEISDSLDKFMKTQQNESEKNHNSAYNQDKDKRVVIGLLIAIAIDCIIAEVGMGLIDGNVISPEFFTNYFTETVGIGAGAVVLSLIIGLLAALGYQELCIKYQKEYAQFSDEGLCDQLFNDIFVVLEGAQSVQNSQSIKSSIAIPFDSESTGEVQGDLTSTTEFESSDKDVKTDNDVPDYESESIFGLKVQRNKSDKIEITKDQLIRFKAAVLGQCKRLKMIKSIKDQEKIELSLLQKTEMKRIAADILKIEKNIQLQMEQELIDAGLGKAKPENSQFRKFFTATKPKLLDNPQVAAQKIQQFKNERLEIIKRMCKSFHLPDSEKNVALIREKLDTLVNNKIEECIKEKKNDDMKDLARNIAICLLIAIAVDCIIAVSMLALVDNNVISPEFFTNYFTETVGVGAVSLVLSLIIGLLAALGYQELCRKYQKEYLLLSSEELCDQLFNDILEKSNIPELESTDSLREDKRRSYVPVDDDNETSLDNNTTTPSMTYTGVIENDLEDESKQDSLFVTPSLSPDSSEKHDQDHDQDNIQLEKIKMTKDTILAFKAAVLGQCRRLQVIEQKWKQDLEVAPRK